MKARKAVILVIVVVLAAAMLAAAAVVWARANSQGSANFNSNGSLISGWYWLRSSGNTATWTFNASALQGAGANSVYINFNPLCTNGTNGGSGYDCAVKLAIVGNRTHTANVNVVNPYRPVDPSNSGGIGYQCYGHSTNIPASVWQGAKKITVTVSYPFPSSRHVAVNAGCMSIGYSK